MSRTTLATALPQAPAAPPAPPGATAPPALTSPQRRPAPSGQLPLPLSWEVAPGIPAIPPVPRHLRLVGAAPERGVAVNRDDVPALEWVARMARAVTEVGSGDRPPGQLTRWVERRQLQMLAARGNAVKRHPSSKGPAGNENSAGAVQQVRAIRICPVAPGVAETSAVLVGPRRARAVAMRFEFVAERWLVTAVRLG